MFSYLVLLNFLIILLIIIIKINYFNFFIDDVKKVFTKYF